MSTAPRGGYEDRGTSETKQAFKTTEFWVYVVALIALFIAGAVTGDGGDSTSPGEVGGGDDLDAGQVWLYAAILTAAYMVSRGIAKAGLRGPEADNAFGHGGEGIGGRVKAAADVLRDGPGTAETAAQPSDRAEQPPPRRY